MTPLVSVCMPTYNHAKYIRKAIESVLSQKVDFPIELLIGEDESDDSTREIVRTMAAQHPEQIKAFYNDRSNVLFIGGHPTGRRNLINLLNHACGRYVALLDGDDYWIDSSKIQLQVDFMERNPEFAMCFHDARIVDMNGDDSGRSFCDGRVTQGELAIEKLTSANLVQIGTALFRRRAILPLRVAEKVRAYDWLLVFIASENGKLQFIDKTMSAYRIHSGGVWQKMSSLEQAIAEIEALWEMNVFLDKKFHGAFCESIAHRKVYLDKTGQLDSNGNDMEMELLTYFHGELQLQKELTRELELELSRIKSSFLWKMAKRVYELLPSIEAKRS